MKMIEEWVDIKFSWRYFVNKNSGELFLRGTSCGGLDPPNPLGGVRAGHVCALRE